MKKIPTNSYSLSEWNNAVTYLYREKMEFGSVSEAKEFICRNCRRKKKIGKSKAILHISAKIFYE